MNRILSVCAALCLMIIPTKAVKADITAPIVYLDHAIPSVSLNINGKEVNRLAIDTGASASFYVPQSVFDSIFPAYNHRTTTSKSSVDLFGVERSAVVTRGANIIINGKNFSDADVKVFKPWGNGMLDDNGQPIIDGVLGLGITKNKTMVINYASKMLTITDNLETLPDGYRWQAIPFTRTENGIEINVLSDNKNIRRMVIDTGASHTVIFTRSEKGCVHISLSCPKQTIVTPDGVRLSALLFQVTDDRINFDGLLGDDFLSNRVLIIANDQLLISLPNND
ncbi:hypothetical protein [Photorhabdus heterorhabditis]|uniref:hypothetical protein n=1 Tax=Photorhabdus heterorhabditis TaxID=880156 RepID=UPI001561E326|nr:hypothetical protein [Photorhabdus heterorhabditis]NRN30774.1 hypothetical protein [Photorhabdus heterorhabditis subsp. aluminescens]